MTWRRRLWKEDIRECKILAAMLTADRNLLSGDSRHLGRRHIRNIEIAELTCMNLFQHLPYAPAKSFHWIADEREYVQTCGFSDRCPSSDEERGYDRTRLPANYSIRQSVLYIPDSYHVRNAAMLAIRKYMQHSEEHAFQVCRLVEGMAGSTYGSGADALQHGERRIG